LKLLQEFLLDDKKFKTPDFPIENLTSVVKNIRIDIFLWHTVSKKFRKLVSDFLYNPHVLTDIFYLYFVRFKSLYGIQAIENLTLSE
jgi:hypothetical protein